MSKHRINFIDSLIILVLSIITFVTAYPLIFVISMSISDSMAVYNREVFFLPKGFSLESYKIVLNNREVWLSYINTIIYSLGGTALTVTFTMMAAYSLSRKIFKIRKYIMTMIVITMFFSGGLIPLFIVVNKLGIYNTRLAVILPVMIQTWWLIISRSFFNSTVPDSLIDSGKIDGCSEFGIFVKIALPLSKTIIAVVALFSAVYYWNSYFLPLIFLADSKLYPLTIILRKILIDGTIINMFDFDESAFHRFKVYSQIKYSTIVITILPIMCVYPFLQKYFIKGVLLGAIKE